MTSDLMLEFELRGICVVPDGTVGRDGVYNQFVLQSGHVVSIQATIEIASGVDTDDHRDLTFDEAQALGLMIELRERSVELADPTD